MGGMAAQIPIANDKEANEKALEKVSDNVYTHSHTHIQTRRHQKNY